MVIQRIQTLWLLIAVVLLIIVGVRPFAWYAGQPVDLYEFPVLVVINWLVVCILAIAIFSFKNLKFQKTLTLVGLLLMAALVAAGFVYQIRVIPAAVPEWGGGGLLVLIAAVCDIFAYRGMTKDQKRLRSADRLWS